MTKYRSEKIYGSGIRDIKKVVQFEIFELGNIDILKTLLESINSVDNSLADEMTYIIQDIQQSGYVEDMFEDEEEDFCERLVQALNFIHHKNITHCLWLADYDAVMNQYGKGRITAEDIDAYETSGVILSDLGIDGRLYAYEGNPEPIKRGSID